MAASVCYFTGTGNSLWAARALAERLDEASLVSMAGWKTGEGLPLAEILVLVFPVYMWGVPAPVIRFIDRLPAPRQQYVCAVALNGGQVANTLVELKGILKKKGMVLACGFEITAPSNYIPWGGPGPREEQDRYFSQGAMKMERIVAAIEAGAAGPVERGPLWQRILFTAIHKATFPLVPRMDRKFWVDDKCNGCGMCKKVCPVGNIDIIEGRPKWNGRCEQCLACIQWCPKEALQYGKKTPHYERYHHPQVTLKDMLERVSDR